MLGRFSIILILAGISLPVATLAQTARNQKGATRSVCEVIAAVAPDSDDMALGKGCTQKEFNVLRNTALARKAPQALPRAPKGFVKASRPSVQAGSRRDDRRAYPAALDMRVAFGLGSAVMTPQAEAEARVFAAAMQSPALANLRFTVGGHTDASGGRAYNLDLSRQRAESVVTYLVAQGADRSRLMPSGYGFDRPRPGLSSHNPANRRVEFSRAN